MIALVNVAWLQEPSAKPTNLPMGLVYLGSALHAAGYPVKLYHISQHQIEATAREIAAAKPLFMGVSVLTGVSTLHNLRLSQRVRDLEPTIPIIWGGHHPTAAAAQCLAEPCIDYVFMGEGEEGIVQFARAIEGNGAFEHIAGLAMVRDGQVRRNSAPVLIQELDKLCFDISLLENPSQYVSGRDNVMMFQSSRGCPFQCAFCDIAQFYSHSYRRFSDEYVLRYARQYRDLYGVRSFHMTDDILFLNERDIRVMRGVRDLGLKLGPVALRISHAHKHPEVLGALAELDVDGVFLAWESGADRILKLMHKDIDQECILQTVRILAERYPQITCMGGAIVGNPTETRDEIRQTAATAAQLRAIHPNCHFFLQMYLPLPGTEFLRLAVQDGMEEPKRAEEWAWRDPSWNKDCVVDWLPWATSEDKRLLIELDRYYRHITEAKRGGPLVQFVVGLFGRVGAYRHRNLRFSGSGIDIWLFYMLLGLRKRVLNLVGLLRMWVGSQERRP